MMKESASPVGDSPNMTDKEYPVPILCLSELLDDDEDEDLVYVNTRVNPKNGTTEQRSSLTVSCPRPNRGKQLKRSFKHVGWIVAVLLGLLEGFSCYMSYYKEKHRSDDAATMDPLLSECMSVLERHSHEIHCIFLVVVTLQAIQKSWKHSHRTTKKRKRRKERRLEEENPTITTRGSRGNRKRDSKRGISTKKGNRRKSSNRENASLNTCVLFMFAILCYVLIIPYFRRFDTMDNAVREMASFLTFGYATKANNMKTLPQHHPKTPKSSQGNHQNGAFSLLELLLLNLFSKATAYVQKAIKKKATSIGIEVSKRMASMAVTRPFVFRFRTKQVLVILRWAKFIAPMIGVSNKLKGHICDGIRKSYMRRRKRRAQKNWDILLKKVREKHRLEIAVRHLQFAFRKRMEERALRRLKYMAITARDRPKSASNVYARIEARLKREAEEAKAAQEASLKLEVERLEKRIVNNEDKEQIQSFRIEQRSRRRLLLRPNTTFSVLWKLITIPCVAIELSKLVIAPRVSKDLVDTPLSQMMSDLWMKHDQCKLLADGATHSKSVNPFAFIPNLPKRNTVTQSCASGTFMQGQTLTFTMMARIFQNLSPLISLVSFLDVFVTFFTGEYSSDGKRTLVPRGFFPRWILPGICLQLIVNPTMHTFGSMVGSFLEFCNFVGAFRVVHIIMLMRPLLLILSNWCWRIVHVFVEVENKMILSLLA